MTCVLHNFPFKTCKVSPLLSCFWLVGLLCFFLGELIPNKIKQLLKLFWAILGCTGLNWAVLSQTLNWFHFINFWCNFINFWATFWTGAILLTFGATFWIGANLLIFGATFWIGAILSTFGATFWIGANLLIFEASFQLVPFYWYLGPRFINSMKHTPHFTHFPGPVESDPYMIPNNFKLAITFSLIMECNFDV